jgi:L-rhamnose mutarotase
MSKQAEADLILKLYDLRREETMRQARSFMASFNPTSMQDIMAVATGENNAYMRMVMSYWDMAASLVNNGAIDAQMFNDANGEHFFYYAKFEPFLEEMRATFGPQMWMHLEKLVMSAPNAKERLVKIREMQKKMAENAAARSAAASSSTARTDEQPTQTASGATFK